MQTISFQVPAEMNKALESFAKEFKLSKAHLLRQALEEYMEDLEDIRAVRAARAQHEGEDKTYSLEEIKQRYGLE